jgi:hypothetical protein
METPYDHEDDEATGPRTIDGEVLPIQVDLGDARTEALEALREGFAGATAPDEMPEREPAGVLASAIAEHFGVPIENLTGFVAAVEYTNDEGITLSSTWSLGVPAWRLRAFATELSKHLDQV